MAEDRFFCGVLNYYGLFNSCIVRMRNTEIDLLPEIKKSFKALDGKPVKFELIPRKGIEVRVDGNSEFLFKHQADGLTAAIVPKTGAGWKSFSGFFDATLLLINGRKIICEVTEKNIFFFVNKGEKVFGVRAGNNGLYILSKAEERKICLAGGGSDVCIFCKKVGKDLVCEKFNFGFSKISLALLSTGKTLEKRIGNCELSSDFLKNMA